jgi:ATP-dependent DNA helicase RecG
MSLSGPDPAAIRLLLATVRQRPSSEVESEKVEFKGYGSESALHNAKDLSEELSALANHLGGVVILGVKAETDVEHGDWPAQLSGMPVVDPLETRARIAGRLRPVVDLTVYNVEFEQRNYVAIVIGHPDDTLVGTSSGKFYMRDGRSSRPMSPAEIETAVKALTKYDWSADPLSIPPVESLDPEALDHALREFCQAREIDRPPSPEAFLEAIGATINGRLSRGGLVFLGREEAIRKAVGDHEYRFTSRTKAGKLVLNEVWAGCIWTAVRRAKSYFADCNKSESFQLRDRTFTAPLLDPTAFHEAYLNALVHRDYSSEGMVSVLVTPERLTVTSPGKFYGGVTPENIALHEPRHRNKALARMLMTYHLVDRAGMGVLRMGIGSLRYGRSFPRFREVMDTVEVSMEAKYLKPPITVLAMENEEHYGIPELLILNGVHAVGMVSVEEVEANLARLVEHPWRAIVGAVNTLESVVELCGTPQGVFIRVRPQYRSFMQVGRLFRPSINSAKHVALYEFLKAHGSASNADLRDVLEHAYSSQTSRFLKDAKYVRRTGSGPSARWSLVTR